VEDEEVVEVDVELVVDVLVVLPVHEPVVEASVPGPPAVLALEAVPPPVVVTNVPVAAEESNATWLLAVPELDPPHPMTIAATAIQIMQITYLRVFIRFFLAS
jgi:hypothetical protein